jgi:CubicO group peptidase (beta-lactamase class C family)
MATPYAVDQQRRSTPSSYPAAPLSAAGGLISTVRDLAQFDLSLKKGILLRPDTLALAWRPVTGPGGQRLPHGPGWFVQIYNGEPVAWQFGQVENASSVLMVTAPARGLTLILLANSVGLVKPFPMVAGDVTVSPFARVFLGLFVR